MLNAGSEEKPIAHHVIEHACDNGIRGQLGSALEDSIAAGKSTVIRCTVVVLNYNGKEFLGPCLDSLRAQTCRGFDVIVVDNGSTDGSQAFVQSAYPEIQVMALDENYGFCRANNLAVTCAIERGREFILLLNNDTVVASDALHQMLLAADAHPEAGVLCPKIYFPGEERRFWYAGGTFSLWTGRQIHRGWKKPDTGQFDTDTDINLATGCAFMIRAAVAKQVGLLDERFFAYLEDVEWSVRVTSAGYRIRFVPQATIIHYDGATWTGKIGKGSRKRPTYFSSRNLVLLFAKHARWYQLPTCIIGNLFCFVGFYTALRILRRDWQALWAIYRGLYDGFRAVLTAKGEAQR